MCKRAGLWAIMAFVLSIFSGCATTGSGRNTDAELGSLNSRVASLQGELSAKDQEISRLQSELSDQRAVLNEALADKRAMSSKLESVLADLSSARSQAAPKSVQAAESDLK